MTDRGDLATRPDPEFERRLEADLRDRIFGAAQADDEAVEPTTARCDARRTSGSRCVVLDAATGRVPGRRSLLRGP